MEKENFGGKKKLVVVQFRSPYCSHCQAIKPFYDELPIEYGDKVKLTKLNVVDSPENQQLAAKHGIMGTPTFLFFCGGRPVNGVVGALQKEDLAQAIEITKKYYNAC